MSITPTPDVPPGVAFDGEHAMFIEHLDGQEALAYVRSRAAAGTG